MREAQKNQIEETKAQARVYLDKAMEGDPRKLLRLIDRLAEHGRKYLVDDFIDAVYLYGLFRPSGFTAPTCFMSLAHYVDLREDIRKQPAIQLAYASENDQEIWFMGVLIEVVAEENDPPRWPVFV